MAGKARSAASRSGCSARGEVQIQIADAARSAATNQRAKRQATKAMEPLACGMRTACMIAAMESARAPETTSSRIGNVMMAAP